MIEHQELKNFSLQEPRTEGEFHVNCIGARARGYFPESWFEVTDRLQQNEETIEWLDMFETVRTSAERVVFADLGAGYGRWLVNAALAAKQLGKSVFLIGVEAEETHFRWMSEHLADNGLKDNQFRVLHAALSDEEREVWFTEGHSDSWYGQSLLPSPDHGFGDWKDARVVSLKTIPAIRVFDDVPLVDGLHVDIQGEEQRVIPHLFGFLNERVRHVHISTHGADIHEQIGTLFRNAGWTPRRVMPFLGKDLPTEIGPISVNDGLQSWRNPNFG